MYKGTDLIFAVLPLWVVGTKDLGWDFMMTSYQCFKCMAMTQVG